MMERGITTVDMMKMLVLFVGVSNKHYSTCTSVKEIHKDVGMVVPTRL